MLYPDWPEAQTQVETTWLVANLDLIIYLAGILLTPGLEVTNQAQQRSLIRR